uniref:Late embryogenesis abundant n=1 Tax=Cleistogenes songorica TaxID=121774 RepID=A0A2S1WLR4_9POAL|nr:late embryogenesis abundant [Cleistogenes songorica]
METGPKIECTVVPEQPEGTDPGRVFDADPVAPRDAAESFTEQLARGGGPARVVEETYDTKVKIAEALEASAREIGDQPIETSDAAAICAAEKYAVGAEGVAVPGGVAEGAQAAADANAHAVRDEDKVTFADVLTWESTVKLPTGIAVTSEVASTAAEAEATNDSGGVTRPGGVSQALKHAAMHNCEHECAS